MMLYVVHGNTYYDDSYGYIENLFGIYTEKDQAEAAKDTVIKELYNKEIGNIKIYLKEKKSQKKKLFGFLNC